MRPPKVAPVHYADSVDLGVTPLGMSSVISPLVRCRNRVRPFFNVFGAQRCTCRARWAEFRGTKLFEIWPREVAPHRHSLFSHVGVSWYMRHGLVITTRDCARGYSMRNFIRELCPGVFYTYGKPMFLLTDRLLYTRYPIVARRAWPTGCIGRVRRASKGILHTRAKVSCIQDRL